MEESQDLHSDSVKTFDKPLHEWAEDEGRSNRRGLVAAGAVAGAAGLALASALPADAGSSPDIMALQTAASIENLAIATYEAALTLKFITNKTVAAFATMTLAQHKAHAQAFNSACTALGGVAQSKPDPKYYPVVKGALPSLTSYLPVVKLAITLENVAAETYTKNVQQVTTPTLRTLFGSVAPVEAQHVAILLAVEALLENNLADLIELGPPLTKLPAAAGNVGFPAGFYSTTSASPITEGAVS
jgi:rubrerythrin